MRTIVHKNNDKNVKESEIVFTGIESELCKYNQFKTQQRTSNNRQKPTKVTLSINDNEI